MQGVELGNGIVGDAGSSFCFADAAGSFDDHVAASIPGYYGAQDTIVGLAPHYAYPGTYLVDLGCATGFTLGRLQRAVPSSVKLAGIDSEQSMLDEAAKACPSASLYLSDLRVERLASCIPGDTSLVVAAFTLQFLLPPVRRQVLQDARSCLSKTGGTMLVFEKCLPSASWLVDGMRQAHHDEKERSGLSRDEIAAKDRSLRGFMYTRAACAVEAEFSEAGFRSEPVWQSLLFRGWVLW